MAMGNVLPPPVAQALFYQWFWILAGLTLALGVVVTIRRVRQGFHDDSWRVYSGAYVWLLKGLGALWLLDGLLQAQPLMITRFIGGFLAPLIQGQPFFLRDLIDAGIRVWGINPVIWNEFSTWIQIGIGLLLIMGRGFWIRFGLWFSLAWGLVVWIGGEAMGSIFSGGSWLGGSPGSVLLYMLLALLLLLPPAFWQSRGIIKSLSWGMAGLWALVAILQAWPASEFWRGQTTAGYILSMANMPQPSIFSAPLYAWANQLTAHPALWNAGLVMVFVLLALLWVIRPHSRVTWWLSAAVTFASWWLGQDFGVLGGMGTDPNSGVVVLLTLVVYARAATVPLFGHVLGRESSVGEGSSS